MRAKKFGFNRAKGLKIHYERSKEDDGSIKDTSYSLINPAKSHLNYNLCEGDMVELLEAKKKTAYIRSEKTDVAFYDFVIPYPKDCSVSSEVFFKAVYGILTKDRAFRYCIGAFVHMDESNPHMHYICMPIEKCPEFTKSKDVKVFDEKKGREVTRRIKNTYTEKFNANKIFNKKLFANLHPYMQRKINELGITGTIITPERVSFNNWKKERIEHYNKLIAENPDKKMEYVDAFWTEYQRMNPKKYRKDKPKDQRIADFNEMMEEYKQEHEKDMAVLKADIEKKEAELKAKKKKLETNIKQREDEIIDDEIAKKLYILNEDGSIATDENGFYLYNDYALRIIQHLAGTELENAIAQGGIMSVKEAAEDIDIVNVLKTLPDVRQELIDLARGYSEKDRNKVNNQAGDHDDNSKEII